jgi:hypothetical protein
MGPMYDTGTEVRLTGVVEAVDTMAACCCTECMGGGLHVTLRTATESIEVQLGPRAFLAEKKVSLAPGDAVEIVGSRIPMGGRTVLVARTIAKGDETVTLRDESGRPLWRGGAR